jgi:hypothetical protein
LFFPCDSSTLRYGFNLDSFGAFGAMKAQSSKPMPHRSDMSSGACPIQTLIRPEGNGCGFRDGISQSSEDVVARLMRPVNWLTYPHCLSALCKWRWIMFDCDKGFP